ncbi:MAG: DNA replication and repair protein RecF [Candidatus Saccharimonadales bacterium]
MITNIRLQHFRSYDDASFEFENTVNIIVGPNASGKTNLLESILMVAQGNSFRAQPADMIASGRPWARIDADIQSVHRIVKIENQPPIVKKSFQIDGKDYQRLGSRQQIPLVLFEPNHLLMLSGSPERRRLFADELIGQITPGYGTTVRAYRRSLAQRNKLLKSGQPDDQLFVWDLRLSQLGSQMVVARQTLSQQLNQQLSDVYSSLVKKPTKLTIAYSYSGDPANYASLLLKKLAKDHQLDQQRGFTGAGPHREDLIFTLNDQALSSTASRGENRTALLALKIIELQLIESARQQKPLLLLDDVFSELDGSRRKTLTQLMRDHQTFITTTDADIIATDFAQHAHVVPMG